MIETSQETQKAILKLMHLGLLKLHMTERNPLIESRRKNYRMPFYIKVSKYKKSTKHRRREGLCVFLKVGGKKITIGFSRLVWMMQHNHVIPTTNEIHHLDEDKMNCKPENLICLFPFDYNKIHKTNFEFR